MRGRRFRMWNWWRVLSWSFGLGLFGLCAVAGLIWYADQVAEEAADGLLADEVGELPEAQVGLVLGCAKTIHGYPNRYFLSRIDAAEKLWKAGKVSCFIVSGDNRRDDYNEPDDMKQALQERGVPGDRIVCDYAGLRTLDSIVRAKEIFGARSVVVVSQKFHNERAMYLAKAVGLPARGLNAEAINGPTARWNGMREKLARVSMWLDVHILRTDPKHLGAPEKLPLQIPLMKFVNEIDG